MKTWQCIESALWETWGPIRICRECGYPEELKTLDGHDTNCKLGLAAKEFASMIKKVEPISEKNRKVRLESWGVEIFEEVDDE